MQIEIEDKTIFFNVQYSNRKKMALELTPEGHVNVKAPSKTSQEEITEFLKQNSKPILKLHHMLENREYISAKKTYDEAENFLYMGKACKLADLLNQVPETESEIQIQLKKFYTSKTKEIVKKRVAYFEKIIGVKAKSITVSDSPGAWGTCNSFKDLTFNYRLSMANQNAIDYVVIHELCHIFHMNHDRSFWRKVGTYDKNFKENEAFLSRFGGVMTI